LNPESDLGTAILLDSYEILHDDSRINYVARVWDASFNAEDCKINFDKIAVKCFDEINMKSALQEIAKIDAKNKFFMHEFIRRLCIQGVKLAENVCFWGFNFYKGL